MTPHDEAIHELLSAYLDGQLSSDESARAEQLLRDNAEHRRTFESLRTQRRELQAIQLYKPSAGFTERVVAAAAAARADRPAVGVADRQSSPRGGASSNGDRSGAGRVWFMAASLIAAAAVVAIISLNAWPTWTEPTGHGNQGVANHGGRPDDPANGKTPGSPDLPDNDHPENITTPDNIAVRDGDGSPLVPDGGHGDSHAAGDPDRIDAAHVAAATDIPKVTAPDDPSESIDSPGRRSLEPDSIAHVPNVDRSVGLPEVNPHLQRDDVVSARQLNEVWPEMAGIVAADSPDVPEQDSGKVVFVVLVTLTERGAANMAFERVMAERGIRMDAAMPLSDRLRKALLDGRFIAGSDVKERDRRESVGLAYVEARALQIDFASRQLASLKDEIKSVRYDYTRRPSAMDAFHVLHEDAVGLAVAEVAAQPVSVVERGGPRMVDVPRGSGRWIVTPGSSDPQSFLGMFPEPVAAEGSTDVPLLIEVAPIDNPAPSTPPMPLQAPVDEFQTGRMNPIVHTLFVVKVQR